MKKPSERVFKRFEDDTTLGSLIDVVSTSLGGEMWYRGESKEFKVPAQPKIAREPFDVTPIEPDYDDGTYTFPLRAFTVGEEQEILDFQNNPPSDPYFSKLLENHDDPGWLALARHHDRKTRLVDITSELKVAVYFACRDHPDEDGYVFVYLQLWNPDQRKRVTNFRDLFDAGLGDTIPSYRKAELENPGVLAQNAEMLNKQSSHPGHSVRFDMAYRFESPVVINDRMIRQRGAFLWRRDPTLSLFHGIPNIFVLQISYKAKPRLLRDLHVQRVSDEHLGI